MSIANSAVGQLPIAAEPSASAKGLAPKMRRSAAKPDAVLVPEPR